MIYKMLVVLLLAWVAFGVYFSWNSGRTLVFKNKKWEYFAAFIIGLGVALAMLWQGVEKFFTKLADTATDLQKRFESRDAAKKESGQ